MNQAGATIVTQTCPAAGSNDAFAAWQTQTSRVIEGFAGFLRQTVIPPSPPTQVDWVILQHFIDRSSAMAWLKSDERQRRITEVQPLVVGRDDVHVVDGDGSGVRSAPVSAVISTRVRPGQEKAYRSWEQRIAQAQARSPGFQGYRLEPPVPGAQEDWLAIVRFDTDENLQSWLASPIRTALLAESAPFVEEFHARIAQTGFDQWFEVAGRGGAGPPVWKQNMLVLLMLYPVVFLFGVWVLRPVLTGWAGLAFPVALFIANAFSVVALNTLVPWAGRRFAFWTRAGLAPSTEAFGAAILVALYAAMIAAFTLLF